MGLPGRPFGSKTRPLIRDYLTKDDVIKIVKKAKDQAKEGDSRLLVFLLEQIFGKAIQPVEGNLQGKLIIDFDEAFKK